MEAGGEPFWAFVAQMAFGDATFVCRSDGCTPRHWMASCERALRFFGGVAHVTDCSVFGASKGGVTESARASEQGADRRGDRALLHGRLTMARYPYREIVEMRSTGLTEAKVAHVCGVTLVRVGAVTRAAERLGICWPVPPELGDDELERLLDPVEHFRKFQPDFAAIREAIGVRKLKRKHLKRAYAAYLAMAGEAGGDPYTESTFAVHLGNWAAVAHPEVTMRVNWHAGEEVQVDYAGPSHSEQIGRGKATVKWRFFIRQAGLDMSLSEWCGAFWYMELVEQWDVERNGGLTPDMVSDRSHAQIWWQCPDCGYAWQEASRKTNVMSRKCPACEKRPGFIVPGFNDLATLRPDLAAEWHPHMNRGLTPADVTPGSNKPVWWRAACGRTFQLKVCVRAKAKVPSCPYCSGKKVPERPIKGMR